MRRAALLICVSVLATACVVSAQPIGLHFDVEPHTLPTWANDKIALSNSYIDLISQLKDVAVKKRLTMDVAFEYSTLFVTRPYRNATAPVTQPLLAFVLDAAKNAMLMDYRNFASTCPPAPYKDQAFCVATDSILSHGHDALIVARDLNDNVEYQNQPGRTKVQLGIAVETDPKIVPVKLTFGTMTEKQLEVALTEANTAFTNAYPAAMSGVAVHALQHYNNPKFLNIGNQEPLPPAAQRVCRGLFVWQQDYVLDAGAMTIESLIKFAHAHAVGTVYIESQTIVSEPATYSAKFTTFVTRMRAAGVGVEMLFGNKIWALKDNHAAAVTLAKKAVALIDSFAKPSAYPKPAHCTPSSANDAYYTSPAGLPLNPAAAAAAGAATKDAIAAATAANKPAAAAAAPAPAAAKANRAYRTALPQNIVRSRRTQVLSPEEN